MTQTVSTIDEALLEALERRGFTALHVGTGAQAREVVLEQLPQDALVAHGGSTTLQQIGLVDALRDADGVRYANAQWTAEPDAVRRLELRKALSVHADVFIGSIQAVTRAGEVVGADQSGSRQAFYVYGPAKVVWIVGANKIVNTLDDAMSRLRDVVTPLEDARVKANGMPGTDANKVVIFNGEAIAGRITVILVDESLGF